MATEIAKTSSSVLEFLRKWIELLSTDEYEEAVSWLLIEPKPVREYGFRHLLTRVGLRPPPDPFVLRGDYLRGLIQGYRSGACVPIPSDCIGFPSVASLRTSLSDDDVTGSVHDEFPFAVYWFTEPSSRNPAFLGYARIDFPLDGEWSDLSAEFDILDRGDFVILELGQVGVL